MTERAGRPAWTRRRVLALGVVPAAVLAAGGGAELVSHGALPGRSILERLDGACSVAGPRLEYSSPGPSFSGTFYSAARRQPVGYTIAYPPGHRRGDELPLVVMLHGYGGSHADALAGMSPAQALALKAGGRPLLPMAMVTVTHAAALGHRPVRVAVGYGDPFYPGVQALARALPAGAVVAVGSGCHDGSFFAAQEPPSLAFLAAHLAT